jgi:hypothetical protein
MVWTLVIPSPWLHSLSSQTPGTELTIDSITVADREGEMILLTVELSRERQLEKRSVLGMAFC